MIETNGAQGDPPAGDRPEATARERSETDGAGGRSPAGRAAGAADPEVPPKAKRRRFTAAYKQRIVAEADACAGPGEVGALLRREGLYSSHLSDWRKQRDAGAAAGLADQRRGRKRTQTAAETEVAQLRRENATLKRQLAQAQKILDIQKKAAEILEVTLPPLPSSEDDS